MILVAIVVLFFLQDWKAMILPMIDVPVSLVGTFAVMAVMGFSLNNLTLFGLVLAIGIVVDDAIVVLENVERQIGQGPDPREATIKAMDEITGPIIAITLVLSSVFLPGAFIPGITGQFFRQFALTIAASMVISAINAMTLTPPGAVAIFKTAEPASMATHSARRCPGGSSPFSAAGAPGCGCATAASWLCPAAIGRCDGSADSTPCAMAVWRYSCRRARRRARWLADHPAGQSRARLGLPRLQLACFDRVTELLRPGRRPAAARSAPWCCSSTAACSVLTWLGFTRVAHRLHPRAGPGLPAGQRAIARLGLACERTQKVMRQDRDRSPRDRRRAASGITRVAICRAVVPARTPTARTSARCSSSSTPFDERHEPSSSTTPRSPPSSARPAAARFPRPR